MENLANLIKHVDLDRLGNLPPLPYIAHKARIDPDALIMFLAVAFLAAGILTAQGQFCALVLLGFAYPAHKSLTYLGSPLEERKWLTYWAIFCFGIALRPWRDSLLYFIPCHDLIMTGFYVALYYPTIDGYERFQELAAGLSKSLKQD